MIVLGQNFSTKIIVCVICSFVLFCSTNWYIFCQFIKHPGPFRYDQIPYVGDYETPAGSGQYITVSFDALRENTDFGSHLSEVLTLIGIADVIDKIPFFNSADQILMAKTKQFCEKVPLVCDKIHLADLDIRQSEKFELSASRSTSELTYLKIRKSRKYLYIEMNQTSHDYFNHMDVRRLLRPTMRQDDDINNHFRLEDIDKHLICVHVEGRQKVGDLPYNSDFIRKFERLSHRHCLKSVRYFFTDGGPWIRDILDSNHRQVVIDHPITAINFARKFCHGMLLTSPRSTTGWWMGYVIRHQKHVIYRDIEDEAGRFDYPGEWRKLRDDFTSKDLSCI